MSIYAIDGLIPVVHPTAYVHPSATLIGDVIVGPDCYVGPSASLRGDFGRIVLEDGFPGSDTVVEQDGHIGHGAVLHGCRIGKNAMVGMNAVVMDKAVIGESSIVAAMSFVKAGMDVPPRSLVMGAPARIARALRDEEIAWKNEGTAQYHGLTRRSLASMQEVEALTAVEENRPRIAQGAGLPAYSTKT